MPIFALGPDDAPVGADDLLGDGQAQTVAAAAGAGGVGPVEPLEYVLLLLAGQGGAGAGHGQQAAVALRLSAFRGKNIRLHFSAAG